MVGTVADHESLRAETRRLLSRPRRVARPSQLRNEKSTRVGAVVGRRRVPPGGCRRAAPRSLTTERALSRPPLRPVPAGYARGLVSTTLRVRGCLAAVAWSAVALGGCGTGPLPDPPRTTLRIALRADVTGFLPGPPMVNESFTLQANRSVYQALVRFDADLRLQSSIAERWSNPDDRTYSFVLRPGVRSSPAALSRVALQSRPSSSPPRTTSRSLRRSPASSGGSACGSSSTPSTSATSSP